MGNQSAEAMESQRMSKPREWIKLKPRWTGGNWDGYDQVNGTHLWEAEHTFIPIEAYEKSQEQLKIAEDAIEKLYAGFAGMFGNDSLTSEQEMYDMGTEIVMKARAEIERLRSEK